VTVLLEGRGLSVDRGPRRVVHDVDLRLLAGEAVALVGPSGAGKSTLVRALIGLLPAAAGGVWVRERPLTDWDRDALARAVALVAAEEAAGSSLAVEDRVALGRYPHRGPFRPLIAADREAVARALELTGIVHLARRSLLTLSAGERQLAALARGLAQQPEVMLLDEPAAHLDVGHQLRLFRVLDGVRRRGVAVLAVVHELERAAAWADRMLLLHGGRLRGDGRPEEVLSSEACREAFQVTIRAHPVTELARTLYSFDEIGR
jgi:ABC-type cobalamin/Fe3+-siderophores transport system ATPase subunit